MADADRIALRYKKETTFGVTPVGVASQGTLTMDTQPTNNDTYTIDGKTYTLQDVLTDVDGNVFIGGSLAQAKLNIVAAMDLSGVAGTDYATSMTAHTTVDMATFVVDDAVLTAKTLGTAGDALATTETFTAGTNVFDAATLGTTTAGVDAIFTELRLTSESLSQNSDNTNSTEIRDDRQIADVIRTSARAAGDIGTELSYGAYDDLFASAIQSAGWSSLVQNTDTTYDMAAGDNSINDSASQFVIDGFLVNQWVLLSGFTDAANNGLFKITSVVAGKMVLSGGTVVTEAAGDSVTIKMGAQIVNGTTQDSYSVEKEYTDLSNVFALLSGLTVDTMTLSVAAEQIITGSFGFMGKAEVSAASTANVGTAIAAPTNEVMAAVDDVEAILEGGAAFSTVSATVDIANNLRPRPEVASLTPISIGAGAIAVSGVLTAYFASQAIINKFLNFTTSAIVVKILDSAGNRYVIDIPKVKYTQGNRVAGGQNSDIIADMTYSAFRDATENITIRIVRWPA